MSRKRVSRNLLVFAALVASAAIAASSAAAVSKSGRYGAMGNCPAETMVQVDDFYADPIKSQKHK